MRIGIYGGTFNPVHLGHVHLLREVMQTGLLDRILVMPDRTPPHKQAPDLIDGKKRFEMLQLATLGMEGIQVSDFELQREGKSYTYMTLRLLRELYPDDQFSLIMGADMLLSFREWRNWEEILSGARLIAAARDEGEYERLEQAAKDLGNTELVRITPLPVSSTEVRAAAKEGRSLEKLVPQPVADYIRENHLYQQP